MLPRTSSEEPFMYPHAGKNAPLPVQTAIAMFRKMPLEDRSKLPLLYWLLGSGTPEYKVDQSDARYTGSSPYPNARCANCEFFYYKPTAKAYICSWIEGDVKPAGWCQYWRKATGL